MTQELTKNLVSVFDGKNDTFFISFGVQNLDLRGGGRNYKKNASSSKHDRRQTVKKRVEIISSQKLLKSKKKIDKSWK